MPKGENLEKRDENVKITTTDFFLTFVREDVISARSLSNDNLGNFSFVPCINMRYVQRERHYRLFFVIKSGSNIHCCAKIEITLVNLSLNPIDRRD
jgi:hypothetical protein